MWAQWIELKVIRLGHQCLGLPSQLASSPLYDLRLGLSLNLELTGFKKDGWPRNLRNFPVSAPVLGLQACYHSQLFMWGRGFELRAPISVWKVAF